MREAGTRFDLYRLAVILLLIAASFVANVLTDVIALSMIHKGAQEQGVR